MRRLISVPSVLLLFALAGCVAEPHVPAADDAELGETTPAAVLQSASPDPRLTPRQVVRIVLWAMRHNDEPTPDAGIATAFRFASPGNRATTGSIERFAALVKNPVYRPLLNFRSVALAPLVESEYTAQQIVRVTDADGETAFYRIGLSKQTGGDYADCWMTDDVVRVAPLRPKGHDAPPPPDSDVVFVGL